MSKESEIDTKLDLWLQGHINRKIGRDVGYEALSLRKNINKTQQERRNHKLQKDWLTRRWTTDNES